MAKKMLVDAGHPEETRVVVVSGNRIEEFDFESAARKQLKGNIYLAKVTRVEPSLQAAFVEYGGNRHGFLAFSEIHPDYYQIPVADRERLLKQEAEESRRLAEEANEAEESEGARGRRGARRGTRRNGRRKRAESGRNVRRKKATPGSDLSDLLAFADIHLMAAPGEDDSAGDPEAAPGSRDTADNAERPGETGSPRPEDTAQASEEAEKGEDGEALLRSRSHWVLGGEDASPEDDSAHDTEEPEAGSESRAARGNGKKARDRDGNEADGGADEPAADNEGDDAETTTINELTADEEAREELERRPRVRLRDYKIQEVIKRRQIMLVQVVKEERGNKGAALTTYLSLAGRYCVLMPNTPRGGGISRKITNAADRKRLKAIASELDVPEGMGLIIRTAGANRTKAEIRRDYEYLLRLWESVRELTLQSSAPCLVYEEGSLIKRSIRDLYSREIDTVQVEGEDGYKEAKAFMRMLMPSHAKNVQSYKDRIPLFQRFQVEQQLDAMLNPQVQLPSGGYIVLNPTEALVAIDVNSGKSTKEHNIEDTALRTNMEAAEEVARQLRLRDLAGLIVIDFIDMEEQRNNRAVERKLKECLKQDRARIQTGRISMFGLLEMSRQRLRPGMMEVSTVTCDHCQGTGIVRSVESAALRILRACEEEGLRQRTQDITVPCAPDVANYLLNIKRHQLTEIEQRYGVSVFIVSDVVSGRDSFEIKRGEPMSESRRQVLNEQAVRLESAFGLEEDVTGPAVLTEEAAPAEEEEKPRARKGGRKRKKAETDESQAGAEATEGQEEEKPARSGARRKAAESEDGTEPKRRRRRGKRGGRRHRKTRERAIAEASPQTDEAADAKASGEAAPEQPEPAAASANSPEDSRESKEPAHSPESLPESPDTVPAAASAGESARTAADESRLEEQSLPLAPPAAAATPEGTAAESRESGTDEVRARPKAGSRAKSGKRKPKEPVDSGAEETSRPVAEEELVTTGAGKSNGNGHHHASAEGAGGDQATDRKPDAPAEERSDKADKSSEAADTATISKPKGPTRRGWWQRRSF